MQKVNSRIVVQIVAVLLLLAVSALAETITLRDGSKIKGTITKQTDVNVEVRTSYGTLTVDKSNIASIDFSGGTPSVEPQPVQPQTSGGFGSQDLDRGYRDGKANGYDDGAQKGRVGEANRTKYYTDDFVGLGVCMGKGAGALGLYAYLRPAENVGLEVDAGKRIFIVLNQNTGETELFWPNMFTGKVQFYFSGRQSHTQFGLELGGVLAEDAGPGGEVAGTLRLRVSRSLNFDMNLGLGTFADQRTSTYNYFIRKYGVIPDWYTFNGPSVFVMWGLGLGFSF